MFTGMQNFETVKKIYQIVSYYHKNFALLHCVSSYPVPVEEINLKILDLYHKTFPDVTLGYSGHEVGIAVTIAAVALGSKVTLFFPLDIKIMSLRLACSMY